MVAFKRREISVITYENTQWEIVISFFLWNIIKYTLVKKQVGLIYYLFSLSGIFKENHLSQFLYVYFLMLLQRSCFEKNPAITLLWKIWERQKWARCKSLGPFWYLIFLIHSEPFHIFIFMVNIFIIFFTKNKIIIESWISIF